MDQYRYEMEKQVLSFYMPNPNTFQFGNVGTSSPYLRIAAQTNNNHVFVLNMDLTGYPESKPSVYVECMLKDCHGNPMNEASATNHTLSANSRGWTQICHYHPSAWRPDLSLWLVYLKCVIWLNIYEQSLKTGKNMDFYLRHQGKDDVY